MPNQFCGFFLEQKEWGFSRNIVPLSAAIFVAEPQQQRIFTTIGAKRQHYVSLPALQKN
jgi:hypothetical protein